MTIDSNSQLVPPELLTGLRNYWYPVLLSRDLPADKPVGATRVGEKLVLWRDGGGNARCFVDRCAHRSAPLSVGDLVHGRLQCRYHGLQYDGTGQCRFVPFEQEEDGRQARRLCVPSYPVEERSGIVWAYLGDVDVFPPPPLEIDEELTDPSYVSILTESIWEANWLVIRDNTTDPFHLPFLHGHFAARMGDAGIEFEPLPDGSPIVTPEMSIETVRDRLVPVPTEHGIAVRRQDATDDHSTTFDEVEFRLPHTGKVWVPIPDGGNPVRSIQYETPIDAETTVVYAFIGRVVPEADREATRSLLEEFVWPHFRQVFIEDAWISGLQGGPEEAWGHESLLATDAGPARVRKAILDAYEAQQRRRAEHERDRSGQRGA